MITHGADPAGVRRAGRRRSACARGRPLPDRQPVLPHLRLQGRASSPASCAARRSCPHAGVRRAGAVLERVERERITVLPGPPTLYQSILDHPDRDTYDLSSLRARGHRRGRRPGRADPAACATSCRSRRIVTGYGLTEATRHRHDVPARRRPRDHRAHRRVAPIPDVEVRVVDDDGDEVPRGEPGEVVVRGLQRDARLLRRPGGDRATRSTPTAGCTPATSACMDDARLPADHRPQEGHVHRRRLQRLPGRDREPAARPPRRRAGRGGRRARRRGWARWAWRSSCRAPARRSTPDELHRVVRARRWPTTRCRAVGRASTRCRSTRAARSSSTSCGSGSDVEHANTRHERVRSSPARGRGSARPPRPASRPRARGSRAST